MFSINIFSIKSSVIQKPSIYNSNQHKKVYFILVMKIILLQKFEVVCFERNPTLSFLILNLKIAILKIQKNNICIKESKSILSQQLQHFNLLILGHILMHIYITFTSNNCKYKGIKIFKNNFMLKLQSLKIGCNNYLIWH